LGKDRYSGKNERVSRQNKKASTRRARYNSFKQALPMRRGNKAITAIEYILPSTLKIKYGNAVEI